MRSTAPYGFVILAAGQGKRMRSSLPKVLIDLGGEPMLFHILDRVKEEAPQASICIVVGFGREKIEKAVRDCARFKDLEIEFVFQPEQKGTGHAVQCAMNAPWAEPLVKGNRPIIVLPGDSPLVPGELMKQLVEPLARPAALRMVTCFMPDPTGYGRVVRRGKKGSVIRIVEEKDANLREKLIQEVATSTYTFNSAFLKAALRRLSDENAQKEYYLTDVISQAARAQKRIDVVHWSHPAELQGVNTPWELALARRTLNERMLKQWALQGVRFFDPASTWIDAAVVLAEDVVIYPNVLLCGATRIGKGSIIGPHSLIKNSKLGEKIEIKAGSVIENSQIGSSSTVGPYAHLRPESVVGESAKIGNFVELKKTQIGDRTSVAHLSYLGDAQVGKEVNIGCGFVTCNFDGRTVEGRRKHSTVIEDQVFMGSDCQTVAPVHIGKGAYVASGSTITEDVEAGSLAIARSRQVNKSGYAQKLLSREKKD